MPHMTTYGDQMDRKCHQTFRLSVQKWTGSVRPKHFPYLLDEHYARELHTSAGRLRAPCDFFYAAINDQILSGPFGPK